METSLYLLIGTYTKEKSKGIYVYRFDPETAESKYIGLAEVENPSYLTINNERTKVFAVSENEEGASYVNALSFDKGSGELLFLNKQPTNGEAPCNILCDDQSRYVITANYGGGNLNEFKADNDGKLQPLSQTLNFSGSGPDKKRQDKPHMHCVLISPDKKYLFATDLGTDHIYRFNINPDGDETFINEGSKEAFDIEPGSGPRHIVFDPTGKYLYLINELSGTVMVFGYNNGDLQHLQTIAADHHNSRSSGDIAITPDGKYLYASVREKNDGVAVFSIDHESGQLIEVGYEKTSIHPRNMEVSPDGKFLLVANMKSHVVEIFKIDTDSGLLRYQQGKDIKIDMPVCLVFCDNN